MGKLVHVLRKIVRCGRKLVNSDDAAGCCGETGCPAWLKFDACVFGPCDPPGERWVCKTLKCPNGVPVSDPMIGTVVDENGFCWRKVKPDFEVPVLPPGAIEIKVIVRCYPSCKAAEAECANRCNYFPLVPCPCSPGTVVNTWVSCETLTRVLQIRDPDGALKFRCPVWMVRGVCAMIDPNPDHCAGTLPPGATEISADPGYGDCCACCGIHPESGCTHYPETSFDPFGWAAWLGIPAPMVGPCCCGPGRTWGIHGEYHEVNNGVPRNVTWEGTGITTNSGTFHYLDDAGFEDTEETRGFECQPFVSSDGDGGNLGFYSELGQGLGATPEKSGTVTASCGKYVHSTAAVVRDGNGQVIAWMTNEVTITLDRNPGNCADCGRRTSPIDADGNPMPGQDPRSPAQKAHEDGCHGCGG